MGELLTGSEPVASGEDILKRSPKLLMPVVLAYERRLRRYGDTPRGVFWKDGNWQRLRYDILVRVFDDLALAGGLTIHDFGCGYGAFFDYIADHPAMRASRYIGIDMCAGMIEAAQKRINDPRASFSRHLWATFDADYTFVSGTFNMNLDVDETDWDEYIRASLLRLWQKTRRGLAFNLLAASSAEKHDGLYYVAPEGYLEFARTQIDANAELILEPPLPDFTILARRNRSA